MPPSEKHYFILGTLGRSQDGTNASLVRVEGRFTKKKMGGGQLCEDGFEFRELDDTAIFWL